MGARAALDRYFKEHDWELFDQRWLRERLTQMSKGGYENQVTAVVAKRLLREPLIVVRIQRSDLAVGLR